MSPIDTEKVNPLKLPSLPLGWRKGFPGCPAIYFAILGEKILYIGKTIKLSDRWKGHHRLAELENMGEVRIAWLEVSDPKLLPAIEKALIRYFKPSLNNQHIKAIRRLKVKRKYNVSTELQKKAQFKAISDRNMSSKPVAVALPTEVDEWVRSLPNRSEWLRKAIVDAYEREVNSGQ